VPHNLKDKVFTHFTADNIDINDSTLDGKNKVHATQPSLTPYTIS
jgi:hypothetical protein